MGKEQPKLIPECPGINWGTPHDSVAHYAEFLSTIDHSQLLADGLAELSGLVDLSTIWQDVISTPEAYVNGQYGISHAALTWLALNDPSNPLVAQYLPAWATTEETLLAYWFTRESVARCAEGYGQFDIYSWPVDSRLDYVTVALLQGGL